MRYCKLCLQPDTRPGEYIDDKQVCMGCYNSKQDLDFSKRFKKLKSLINKYKTKNNKLFDCILGVSGGKDSLRQALWVRDQLNLRPLLISYAYPPEHLNERGARNLSNLINKGFDVLVTSPSPKTFKEIMRDCFFTFSNWQKASELILYGSVPKIAISHNINMVFVGEDQGQKEQKTLGDEGWDYNNQRELNTLGSGNISWLESNTKYKNKLYPYKYPTIDEFKNASIQVIDLGWFLKDWSFKINGTYAMLNGFESRIESVNYSGDLSNVSSVDEDWVSVNQMIKFYKFGYSKTSDFLNEEIRLKNISRDDAIPLVEKYDGNCSEELIDSFCMYLDINADQFWQTIVNSTNKKLFEIIYKGNKPRFIKKFKVGYGIYK
tara:strand:+ start:181 stop:1314 length:1134 start_codon:yes stop_codon:yes gene_type:complete